MEKNKRKHLFVKQEIVGKSYIYIPYSPDDEIFCLKHFDKLILSAWDIWKVSQKLNTNIVLTYDSEF